MVSSFCNVVSTHSDTWKFIYVKDQPGFFKPRVNLLSSTLFRGHKNPFRKFEIQMDTLFKICLKDAFNLNQNVLQFLAH